MQAGNFTFFTIHQKIIRFVFSVYGFYYNSCMPYHGTSVPAQRINTGKTITISLDDVAQSLYGVVSSKSPFSNTPER